MRYFIQLKTSSPSSFMLEEVNEQVFNDRKMALNDEGLPRYEIDNFVLVDGNEIVDMRLTNCNTLVLGWLCRAFNVTVPQGRADCGAFISTTTTVKFQHPTKNKVWLIELLTGNVYQLKNNREIRNRGA